MNKPRDTLCRKVMFMNVTAYIAFPVTHLDVCILLSSVVFYSLYRPAENAEAPSRAASYNRRDSQTSYPQHRGCSWKGEPPHENPHSSILALWIWYGQSHCMSYGEVIAFQCCHRNAGWCSRYIWCVQLDGNVGLEVNILVYSDQQFLLFRLCGDHSEWVGECVFVCTEDPDGWWHRSAWQRRRWARVRAAVNVKDLLPKPPQHVQAISRPIWTWGRFGHTLTHRRAHARALINTSDEECQDVMLRENISHNNPFWQLQLL